jgi:hypothetical protein
LQSDLPNRDTVERAEDLILRLRDIHSCRITTDETGRISEVHVVAATERLPKMIARDVETCLKAELGLEIDYRKIGVVIIDPMKETDPEKARDASGGGDDWGGDDDTDRLVEEMFSDGPRYASSSGGFARAASAAPEPHETAGGSPREGPAPSAGTPHAPPAADRETLPADREAGLEFLEEDARVRFAGLRIDIEEARIDAEVRLSKDGLEVVGCLGGPRTGDPIYGTIAGATIHALMELLDENFHMCLSRIQEVDLSGRRALLAVVDVIGGRAVRSYAGCVFVGRDPNEAAVLAVLDALNRPSGRWKSRKEIHYHIT